MREDRTLFVPPHNEQNVLPHFPFFSQLLRNAHHGYIAVRDLRLDLEKSYEDLLLDAVTLRGALRENLAEKALEKIDNGDDVCIGVLAPGGYEYVVAVLAVLSLGAAVVPMTVAVPVEEADYFVSQSGQIGLLHSQAASDLASSISDHIQTKHSFSLPTIPIHLYLNRSTYTLPEIYISSSIPLSDAEAGVVIFTSGTSGPPKGCVLRRGYIHEASRSVADFFDLTPNDRILHLLPVHHVTGLAINILPFLLVGARIDFRSGAFDPVWTWSHLAATAASPKTHLTIFSGVPTIYMRLMRHYQSRIAPLPVASRATFDAGAAQFRALICGTSALPRPVADFWTQLRGGRPILTRYGSSEVGAVLRTAMDDAAVPDGSVGTVTPGVEVELAPGEGDSAEEGEILVRGPQLFARYLGDAAATAAAHDARGFFRTGDIARREGRYYFIVGRASQDIIKSGGYKISALDVEREALALPYVGEVMVVGVEDEEFGQRVAAAVTLRDGTEEKDLTLERLRSDMRGRMAAYKLPTLLRLVKGELPKTASGKVQKKLLGPQMFPSPGWEKEEEVQAWRSKAERL